MFNAEIIKSFADDLIKKYNTNDPEFLIDLLDIRLYYRADFEELLGFYTIVNDINCIFINSKLDYSKRKTVAAHELGHFVLHKNVAYSKALHDTFFDLKGSIEYEANAFAAQLLIPDSFMLKKIDLEYDIKDIADEICVVPELVQVKIQEMIRLGHKNLRSLLPKVNFLAK